MSKKIVCIFCGEKADIINRGGSELVACSHCCRETEFGEYRENLDNWLDEVHKKA